MRSMRVSVGQIDTSALLASMAALRSEAQSVRDRIVSGSIPHARLSDLIDEIERNAALLGGGAHAPASDSRKSAQRPAWKAAPAFSWAPVFSQPFHR